MSDCIVRIEKLENGFEVEVYEPAPPPKGGGKNAPMTYQEPWKGYGFSDVDGVVAFLKQKLPTLHTPDDEFGEGFADATEDDEDD